MADAVMPYIEFTDEFKDTPVELGKMLADDKWLAQVARRHNFLFEMKRSEFDGAREGYYYNMDAVAREFAPVDPRVTLRVYSNTNRDHWNIDLSFLDLVTQGVPEPERVARAFMFYVLAGFSETTARPILKYNFIKDKALMAYFHTPVG